jgi:hypothetical protein
MRKCILLGFLLIFVCLNNTFGQEFTKNTIYGGISTTPVGVLWLFFYPVFAVGLTTEYEYSFNNRFSASIEIGIDPPLILYADIKGRWYPWSKSFFLGLGVGAWGMTYAVAPMVPFLAISPTLSWKINRGSQNKWVLTPYLTYREIFNNEYFEEMWIYKFKAGLNIGYKF